jgi:hypothetical protein
MRRAPSTCDAYRGNAKGWSNGLDGPDADSPGAKTNRRKPRSAVQRWNFSASRAPSPPRSSCSISGRMRTQTEMLLRSFSMSMPSEMLFRPIVNNLNFKPCDPPLENRRAPTHRRLSSSTAAR